MRTIKLINKVPNNVENQDQSIFLENYYSNLSISNTEERKKVALCAEFRFLKLFPAFPSCYCTEFRFFYMFLSYNHANALQCTVHPIFYNIQMNRIKKYHGTIHAAICITKCSIISVWNVFEIADKSIQLINNINSPVEVLSCLSPPPSYLRGRSYIT